MHLFTLWTYQDEVSFLIDKFEITKPKTLNGQLNDIKIIIVDTQVI